uniref:ATP synthase subunit g, mitochondrial-like n=1 Tax=Styela clava TaxID=7725 RepID=UPI00193A66B7|nr:ATP synthase subunit g, mitochondrial-like [Styela clava]XP_039254538.1 ATP synthase subunit g, mitochondrial-like [Styela clava]
MAGLAAKIPVWSKAVVSFSRPKLQTFYKYAKVELRPPTPGEMSQAVGDAQKGIKSLISGKFMELSVKQGWQNTLVATEILMWFFVGEIIGRRSLIGYKV